MILALDLGTRTGFAYEGKKHSASGFYDTKLKNPEGAGMRFLRFRRWLDTFMNIEPVTECYFEEVKRHNGTLAAQVYGGYRAELMSWCEENDVPYEGVGVGTIKKFATGKGNASKDAMILEACLDSGRNIKDDNEADAYWILQYALSLT